MGVVLLEVFTLLFVGGGLFYVVTTLRDRRRAQQAPTWPVSTGEVIESRVEMRRLTRGGPVYEPLVTYEYRVGDRVYLGRQVWFGPPAVASEEAAHALIARFPVGSRPPVRYRPARPDQGVLLAEVHGSLGQLIGGVFAIGIGLVFQALAVWAALSDW